MVFERQVRRDIFYFVTDLLPICYFVTKEDRFKALVTKEDCFKSTTVVLRGLVQDERNEWDSFPLFAYAD